MYNIGKIESQALFPKNTLFRQVGSLSAQKEEMGRCVQKKWGGACKRANLHKKDQGKGTG